MSADGSFPTVLAREYRSATGGGLNYGGKQLQKVKSVSNGTASVEFDQANKRVIAHGPLEINGTPSHADHIVTRGFFDTQTSTQGISRKTFESSTITRDIFSGVDDSSQFSGAAGSQGYAVIVADINGDGTPNIVAATVQDIVWYQQTGPKSYTRNTIDVDYSNYPNNSLVFSIVAGDFNGNGRTDIAVMTNQNEIRVYEQASNGSFSPSGGVGVTGLSGVTTPSGLTDMVVINVDNRGGDEIAYADGTNIRLLRFTGGGAKSLKNDTQYWTETLLANRMDDIVYIDRRGLSDVTGNNRANELLFLENNASSALRYATPTPNGPYVEWSVRTLAPNSELNNPVFFTVGDFTGNDTGRDILVAQTNGNNTSLILTPPNGTWDTTTPANNVDSTKTHNSLSLQVFGETFAPSHVIRIPDATLDGHDSYLATGITASSSATFVVDYRNGVYQEPRLVGTRRINGLITPYKARTNGTTQLLGLTSETAPVWLDFARYNIPLAAGVKAGMGGNVPVSADTATTVQWDQVYWDPLDINLNAGVFAVPTGLNAVRVNATIALGTGGTGLIRVTIVRNTTAVGEVQFNEASNQATTLNVSSGTVLVNPGDTIQVNVFLTGHSRDIVASGIPDEATSVHIEPVHAIV